MSLVTEDVSNTIATTNAPTNAIATLTDETTWELRFVLRDLPTAKGRKVDRIFNVRAHFIGEDGYEPPQGLLKQVATTTTTSANDESNSGNEAAQVQITSSRWLLSEDPEDRKDGLWIWGLFEEPLFPFMLLQLTTGSISLPGSEGDSIEPLSLFAQINHRIDEKTGTVLSRADVKVRETETFKADLLGISTAELYEEKTIGQCSFRPLGVAAPAAASKQTPRTQEPVRSQAIPFVMAPAALDGTMAGDVGFDPLGFASSANDLSTMREAEIKHARLAMLAAAGWPLSELFDRPIANALGWNVVLDETNRAPSVLNGGLGKISLVYWGACLLAAAAVEGLTFARMRKDEYFPGNLGFDPLGLYPKDEGGRMRMQTTEIKNGRLAMLAITAFAALEFVNQQGVVDQAPLFFKPITETLFASHPSVDVPTAPVNDIAYEPVGSLSLPTPSAPVDPVAFPADRAAVDIAPAVEGASVPVAGTGDEADLMAADKRIAELEAKLAEIAALVGQ